MELVTGGGAECREVRQQCVSMNFGKDEEQKFDRSGLR
jgi:hypothetical protein